MRTSSFLLSAALCAFAAPAVASSQTPHETSLVDVVTSDPQLSTLEAALQAAGLVEALQGDGPFTVLAPTNEAFAALDPHVLADLLEPENKTQLQSILLYHVVPQRLEYGELAAQDALPTLNGQRIAVGRDGAQATVDGARFGTINAIAGNGFVQVVDRVLLPTEEDVVGLATKAGSFHTLLTAAKAAGLVEALQGPGPITVLAPTDEAFAKLGDETIQTLLEPENKAELARILQYHVIPGRVFADEAIQAGTAASLTGDDLRFRIRSGRLFANDAAIVGTDLDASNGVVHVVDGVLLPPPPQGRLVIGYNTETPSRARAAQLGIDRHSAVVVSSVTRPASGLQVYDVLTKIDGETYSKDRIEAAKKRAGYRGTVRLTLFRDGKHLEIDAPVGVDPH